MTHARFAEFSNVVCAGCACLCDDIELQLRDGRLQSFAPECAMGRQWFSSHLQREQAACQIDETAQPMEHGIERAAELLHASQYPLIYGLSRSATPGQRAAVALGDQLGAVVDTTASICHGPSIMALQEFGEVTSTLGEVRNRADLLIYWGCDPAQSHPRHAERYAATARGKYLPGGRQDRRIVMIGVEDQIANWQLDAHGTEPDLRIAIPSGRDFEAISWLRRCVSERLNTRQSSDSADNPARARQYESTDETLANRGISALVAQQLESVIDMATESKYGAVFFGLGLAETKTWMNTNALGRERTGVGQVNVAALLQLVAELNSITRFVARRMRLQGDVSGADSVLCWQAGFPFAVDFSLGYPRHNPGEFTANELLQRGDVDAAVLVGAETVPLFSDAARSHLDSIPTIVLDHAASDNNLRADVRFNTSVYGIHEAATAYRMDNVPIRLKKLLPSDLPSDEHVLNGIAERLRRLQV